ncbi:adenine specific DNA methyltransferase [Herbaspirillum sp. GW103]|uniref:type ISP restriction/modification enzyme n=1 Tax=Herbaspirillum sp. GW103 TaxID=1175306 RepID=UPI00025E2B13|nr:type ISP restriction/modification enzyme [Herbaspirillum sp. GW103]EIJ45917.1 adenine specific DNA methyltransferase [Herbaspirillum sp. GW103]
MSNSASHAADVASFLTTVIAVHKSGAATEHSYRPALTALFNKLKKGVVAINEPKREACGAPDFIFHGGELAIGHAEAKDIGVGLRRMKDANKRQQERYLKALPNLLYTNCLDWDFYRNGELVASVTIADYLMGIQPNPEQYEALGRLLKDFVSQRPPAITSPRILAEIMAGKTQLIKEVLRNALIADQNLQTELSEQFSAFKEHLIHDITIEDFADIYAETIAYGMFAARLHDTTVDTFSRQEALTLLPKSNPFLRNLFRYLAGDDLDDRIAWIIDDLAGAFQATNMEKIMAGFGKLTGQNDPFLHFYETFLAAYNPSKRKARGVWYTPEPVVRFIVRALDHVLRTDFGLADGLADTSKVAIDWDTGQSKKGKRITIKKEVHRVQILDPATGTGTFLAEVIKTIAPKVAGVAPGMWSSYIENDLIPRLHGFELLMASYAMCHMKLDMILTELGYKPTGSPPRLSIYLTNSLEEGEPANQTLPFAQWLSNEVKNANSIKRDMPIMCVIGNPPYSGVSHNMGEWISGLIEDYKYVDGVHFRERKHWLHDDYVKFIRLSEHLIEKNGDGVVGFITNHGYLDNPTFRGMRWHLLNTFDKIYILDLHGNTHKKEVAPDGKPDKNVFDIQQGVAIIIAVKLKESTDPGLAVVRHGELWGAREEKYQALNSSDPDKLIFRTLEVQAPQYAFIPRDYGLAEQYEKGFGLAELMSVNVTGIVSMGDGFAIAETPDELQENLRDLVQHDHSEATLKAKYDLGKNYAEWILGNKATLAREKFTCVPINYRPFDTRVTYFDNRILWRWRANVMRHMLAGNNLGLICPKIKKEQTGALVTTTICGHKTYDAYDSNSLFPLYLYPEKADIDQTRRINFDEKLYKKLRRMATHPDHGVPDEVAIFDYIYGVLHSPVYREKYDEFLKIDFPRIPWPDSPGDFWSISATGMHLRKLHLLDTATIGSTPFPFTGEGDNVVNALRFENGNVWVNSTQCFSDVPEIAWSSYIGGYQPAQRWLKDRIGRRLKFDDVKHYQRILKVLMETDRIMNEFRNTLS